MENPSGWKTAELTIEKTLEEFARAGIEGRCGLSLPAAIAQALRASGHIRDSEEQELGWGGLRAAREKLDGNTGRWPADREADFRP